MVQPMVQAFKDLKDKGLEVTHVRCDNAEENKSLEQLANGSEWKLGITFEYTTRATPQHNAQVEVGFFIMGTRGLAMMAKANIPDNERCILYPFSNKTACDLDGLTVIEIDGKKETRDEHFYGKLPKFANHLRTWGEAGTVTMKKKLGSKMKLKGIQCMMVGYAGKHAGDCYEMYNPKTKGVHKTRDVTWLNRMYYPRKDANGEVEEDHDMALRFTAGEGVAPKKEKP